MTKLYKACSGLPQVRSKETDVHQVLNTMATD